MKIFKTYLFALTLLFSTTVFIACDEDDDTHTHQEPTQTSEPTAVEIIASGQTSTDSPTGIWQDTIELDKSCLLTINATARARYVGSSSNAGINLNIKLNGEIVASDFSFEGESGSITFNSSASITLFLQPGTYNLEVERVDDAVNTDYNLRANYYAIFAEMAQLDKLKQVLT